MSAGSRNRRLRAFDSEAPLARQGVGWTSMSHATPVRSVSAAGSDVAKSNPSRVVAVIAAETTSAPIVCS